VHLQSSVSLFGCRFAAYSNEMQHLPSLANTCESYGCSASPVSAKGTRESGYISVTISA
jgi:hypothetical protein